MKIIPTNTSDNILYPKRIAYCEMSKIYPIWKLYFEGKLTSKYIGFFHYRRIFDFKNFIPNLDEIFSRYDVMVKERVEFKMDMYTQFKINHIVHFLDECVDIIKEKFPEYSPYVKPLFKRNWANFCNIFIMRKNDFIKWGEFVFGVLLELDKRYNLKSDEDVRNLIKKEIEESKRKELELNYQSRLQAFLSERLSDIFYNKFFKVNRRYETVPIEI